MVNETNTDLVKKIFLKSVKWRFLGIVFLIMSACSPKTNNSNSLFHESQFIPDYELLASDTITIKHQDSAYVGAIDNLIAWKNYILMEDNKLGKIWVFDENFQPITSLGKRGSGPEEFPGPMITPVGVGNTLYIIDRMSLKVNVYDSTLRFVKAQLFPPGINIKAGQIDAVNDSDMLIPAIVWDKKAKKKAKDNLEDYRRSITTVAVVNKNLEFVKNILALEEEYFDKEKSWYYHTFAETATICKGKKNTFFAQHWGSHKVSQFNEKYELMQQFGRVPKNYRTIPKDAHLPSADQGTDKRYAQSSFYGFVGYDVNNNLYCAEYKSLTEEGLAARNVFLYKRFLQVYNNTYDCVLDEPLPGPLRLVHKGKLYVLIEDSPEKIRFIVYTLRKKNNS